MAEAFADRLREVRESRGITQAVLAEACGISRPSVTNMETGRQKPSLDRLVALSRALQIPVGALIGEEPMPPLPARPVVTIDIEYVVTCDICGPIDRCGDRALAELARAEHKVPHEPEGGRRG